MRATLQPLFLFAISAMPAQNNLLDTSTWARSNGSVSGFSRNGSQTENVRKLDTNPHGDNTILWKAVPDATNNADDGWNGSYLTIDPNKTYRLSVWTEKAGNTNGRTYFGLNSLNGSGTHSTLLLGGTTERPNANFRNGNLPEHLKSIRNTKNTNREMSNNSNVPQARANQITLHFTESYWRVYSTGNGHKASVFDVFCT